jgi:hypothetical protein
MGGQRVTFVINEHGRDIDRTPPTKEQAEANRTMARQAIKVNEARSQQVTALFEGMDAPKVKHATIGEGVAATMSHASQTHGQGVAPGEIKDMPEALAIAENPDWWQILGDRDIGQPVTDYFTKGYRWQPGEFNADHKKLGRASDVANANAMTALETGMVTLRGLVTEVQQFSGTETWPVAANWRIQLDGRKWLYVDNVSFAGGLGAPKKHPQFSESLEQQLLATNRMTYAQQALIPPAPEGGTILVIGDSGTAGWAAQEAVRAGRKAIIVARNPSLPGVPPHVRKDLTEHGVEVVTGEVDTAALEGNKVVLTMKGAVRGQSPVKVHGDAVSMAIGQQQVLPRGFEDLHFRPVERSFNGKPRIVALESYDPKTNLGTGVVVEGAQMTTRAFKEGPKPFVKDREKFVEALSKQANDPDVPEGSRGVEPSIHQSGVNIPLANEKQK